MAAIALTNIADAQSQSSGRFNEQWQVTTLATRLKDPWDISFGPDNRLWITEARGYKVLAINPQTNATTVLLRLDRYSNDWPDWKPTFNTDGPNRQDPWPQGGMMGMAFHPEFNNATTPKRFVFLAYVRSSNGTTGVDGNGRYFTTWLTRWTYNPTLQRLENPLMICDTIPGSNDHNGGRMTIANVEGKPYLFYSVGDMGAGQFQNASRTNRAQETTSYQGKILRFNLDEDDDAEQAGTDYNKWIPNDNPYNQLSPTTQQSAIWAIGMRNNQGFAQVNINGTDRLYGSSHGPFSDDELNLLERRKNYGHPLIVGFAQDGNYNNAKAARPSSSSLPLIASEQTNASQINGTESPYRDPIFSWYAASASFIQNLYLNNIPSNNREWPSEAPSGMEAYTSGFIPGWKNSLLSAMLKGHEPGTTPTSSPNLMRLKLNADGTGVQGQGTVSGGARNDTIRLFNSSNRFRDVAVSMDGRDIYVVIDSSATTSGPTTGNPLASNCRGCVVRFRFAGYPTVDGTSAIPSFLPLSDGVPNTCITLNPVDISPAVGNSENWMPLTDADGNLVAEINAQGNDLGKVTARMYRHSGPIRIAASGAPYANRNLTITVEKQPTAGSPVLVRYYFSKADYEALVAATATLPEAFRITSPDQLEMAKTEDGTDCIEALQGTAKNTNTRGIYSFGTDGYVIDAEIDGFSTFFIGKANLAVLPVTFAGISARWQDAQASVTWETLEESQIARYEVQRSLNGINFQSVGSVQVKSQTGSNRYSFLDATASTTGAAALFYRIQAVEKNGTTSLSGIAALQSGAALLLVKALPNPAATSTVLHIQAPREGMATLQWTDMTGRQIRTEKIWLTRGQNTVPCRLDQVAGGTYQVWVHSQGQVATTRVQKL